jgi:hypothetical protein
MCDYLMVLQCAFESPTCDVAIKRDTLQSFMPPTSSSSSPCQQGCHRCHQCWNSSQSSEQPCHRAPLAFQNAPNDPLPPAHVRLCALSPPAHKTLQSQLCKCDRTRLARDALVQQQQTQQTQCAQRPTRVCSDLHRGCNSLLMYKNWLLEYGEISGCADVKVQ